MTWQLYLPESRAWLTCTLDRAVAWILSGGQVRCDS